MNSKLIPMSLALSSLLVSLNAKAEVKSLTVKALSSFEGDLDSCEEVKTYGMVCRDDENVYFDDALLLEHKEGGIKLPKIKVPDWIKGAGIGSVLLGPAGAIVGAWAGDEVAEAKKIAELKAQNRQLAAANAELIAAVRAQGQAYADQKKGFEAVKACWANNEAAHKVANDTHSTGLTTLVNTLNAIDLESPTASEQASTALSNYITNTENLIKAMAIAVPACG